MPRIITANGTWRITEHPASIDVVEGNTTRRVRLVEPVKYVPPTYQNEQKKHADPVTVEYEILMTVGGETRRARVITKI